MSVWRFQYDYSNNGDATAHHVPDERNLAHTMESSHWSSLRAAPLKRIKDGCIAFTEMKVLPCPRASPYEPSQLDFWPGGVHNKKGDAGTHARHSPETFKLEQFLVVSRRRYANHFGKIRSRNFLFTRVFTSV
ncbi:uncharacterized protein LOC122532926 [Frieseomelitta varia]|uniref:uncharacterized protein LOC122532926 n=1 Tax=Frieseomelitta varia TaxID=561572 RepID=UPI001CB67A04|nr:uncharacterized protein LOC122532926 [Frieseomelitta varia]